jgi:hypothetical protein
MNIENLTPFGAISLPSMTLSGIDALLVCVAARYDVIDRGPELVVSDIQTPPPLADEHHGDPEKTSLAVVGQTVPIRPGTDVHLVGHARAPGNRPTIAVAVSMHVGALQQHAIVMGDRVWQKRLVGEASPSAPIPFQSMPLTWEHAFGGVCGPKHWEPRNPVGRGLYRDTTSADGMPLANIEARAQPVVSITDRPSPVGFGPIARSWSPRVELAGTYDQRWIEERAPYYPRDLDPEFFFAAPRQLRTSRHLTGGETIRLLGMHAAGAIELELPRSNLVFGAQIDRRAIEIPLVIDALLIDADAPSITLMMRALVETPGGWMAIKSPTLRAIEAWEST